MKQHEKQQMLTELSRYEQMGVSLYIDGRQEQSVDIVKTITLNEDSIYMPDYVQDTSGRIIQIRYDKILTE